MTFLFTLFSLFFVWALIILIFFRAEIQSTQERDPAARGIVEIVLLYPGLHAVVAHRINHFLWKMKVPLLPRALSQLTRFLTGVEIHPGAEIGKGLFIDHGMGDVIGEPAIVGDNVTQFKGSDLGGTGKETGKRHPTIGSNVVIGAGAKVLGNITIGENSYVGANAVIIRDVPSNVTVVGVPGHVTKQEGKKMDLMMDHVHTSDPVMQHMKDLIRRVKTLEDRTPEQ